MVITKPLRWHCTWHQWWCTCGYVSIHGYYTMHDHHSPSCTICKHSSITIAARCLHVSGLEHSNRIIDLVWFGLVWFGMVWVGLCWVVLRCWVDTGWYRITHAFTLSVVNLQGELTTMAYRNSIYSCCITARLSPAAFKCRAGRGECTSAYAVWTQLSTGLGTLLHVGSPSPNSG